MRVLVTGGTGFVGSAVVCALVDRGDDVTVLTRDVGKVRPTLRGARLAHWDPMQKGPWYEELAFVDAVVHLAGTPVFARWNAKVKKSIVDSRVESTKRIVEAIELAGESKARGSGRPSVFVCASAVGYYGADRGDEELDESSEAGNDFLAEVCTKWEEAAVAVDDLGVRSVRLRIGVVLGAGGGALKQMVKPMFVGGPIGRGNNTTSWVHIDDVVGMTLWALDDSDVSGPINCTSPYFTTGKELAASTASVLDMRALPMPAAIAGVVFGESASVLTGSVKAYPARAIEGGYEYHYAHLTPALEASLVG